MEPTSNTSKPFKSFSKDIREEIKRVHAPATEKGDSAFKALCKGVEASLDIVEKGDFSFKFDLNKVSRSIMKNKAKTTHCKQRMTFLNFIEKKTGELEKAMTGNQKTSDAEKECLRVIQKFSTKFRLNSQDSYETSLNRLKEVVDNTNGVAMEG